MGNLLGDGVISVESVEKPWVVPHVMVVPTHKVTGEQFPSQAWGRMLASANTVSSVLFEAGQAQGSNVIIQDTSLGITAHVVARVEKDGLAFNWQPKQGDKVVLEQLAGEISSAVIVIDEPIVAPKVEAAKPPESPAKSEPKKEEALAEIKEEVKAAEATQRPKEPKRLTPMEREYYRLG
jgi:diadenosine tetraphosphate (Ap4A) HIT family hydrolase